MSSLQEDGDDSDTEELARILHQQILTAGPIKNKLEEEKNNNGYELPKDATSSHGTPKTQRSDTINASPELARHHKQHTPSKRPPYSGSTLSESPKSARVSYDTLQKCDIDLLITCSQIRAAQKAFFGEKEMKEKEKEVLQKLTKKLLELRQTFLDKYLYSNRDMAKDMSISEIFPMVEQMLWAAKERRYTYKKMEPNSTYTPMEMTAPEVVLEVAKRYLSNPSEDFLSNIKNIRGYIALLRNGIIGIFEETVQTPTSGKHMDELLTKIKEWTKKYHKDSAAINTFLDGVLYNEDEKMKDEENKNTRPEISTGFDAEDAIKKLNAYIQITYFNLTGNEPQGDPFKSLAVYAKEQEQKRAAAAASISAEHSIISDEPNVALEAAIELHQETKKVLEDKSMAENATDTDEEKEELKSVEPTLEERIEETEEWIKKLQDELKQLKERRVKSQQDEDETSRKTPTPTPSSPSSPSSPSPPASPSLPPAASFEYDPDAMEIVSDELVADSSGDDEEKRKSDCEEEKKTIEELRIQLQDLETTLEEERKKLTEAKVAHKEEIKKLKDEFKREWEESKKKLTEEDSKYSEETKRKSDCEEEKKTIEEIRIQLQDLETTLEEERKKLTEAKVAHKEEIKKLKDEFKREWEESKKKSTEEDSKYSEETTNLVDRSIRWEDEVQKTSALYDIARTQWIKLQERVHSLVGDEKQNALSMGYDAKFAGIITAIQEEIPALPQPDSLHILGKLEIEKHEEEVKLIMKFASQDYLSKNRKELDKQMINAQQLYRKLMQATAETKTTEVEAKFFDELAIQYDQLAGALRAATERYVFLLNAKPPAAAGTKDLSELVNALSWKATETKAKLEALLVGLYDKIDRRQTIISQALAFKKGMPIDLSEEESKRMEYVRAEIAALKQTFYEEEKKLLKFNSNLQTEQLKYQAEKAQLLRVIDTFGSLMRNVLSYFGDIKDLSFMSDVLVMEMKEWREAVRRADRQEEEKDAPEPFNEEKEEKELQKLDNGVHTLLELIGLLRKNSKGALLSPLLVALNKSISPKRHPSSTSAFPQFSNKNMQELENAFKKVEQAGIPQLERHIQKLKDAQEKGANERKEEKKRNDELEKEKKELQKRLDKAIKDKEAAEREVLKHGGSIPGHSGRNGNAGGLGRLPAGGGNKGSNSNGVGMAADHEGIGVAKQFDIFQTIALFFSLVAGRAAVPVVSLVRDFFFTTDRAGELWATRSTLAVNGARLIESYNNPTNELFTPIPSTPSVPPIPDAREQREENVTFENANTNAHHQRLTGDEKKNDTTTTEEWYAQQAREEAVKRKAVIESIEEQAKELLRQLEASKNDSDTFCKVLGSVLTPAGYSAFMHAWGYLRGRTSVYVLMTDPVLQRAFASLCAAEYKFVDLQRPSRQAGSYTNQRTVAQEQKAALYFFMKRFGVRR